MTAVRNRHTATLLPNGKVLCAGGYNGTSLNSAELYDPTSGTWSVTGSMAMARYSHAATLLPNGQVLVAGGITTSGTGTSSPLYSAELYDPAAGTWSAARDMHYYREGFTATLLSNGKVLVAGGVMNGGSLIGTELYDPAAGPWSATGNMVTSRYNHTATLLGNGKVLVAGGIAYPTVNNAELYDPVAGTWSATGSMSYAPRYDHTAALLPNGQVLVAGGYGETHPSKSECLNSTERYFPTAGTWTFSGVMATARDHHTETLLPNGKVLVAGGYNNTDRYALKSAELFQLSNFCPAPLNLLLMGN
jgi:N-acetylneuraminic acid mutarotase